MSILPAMHQIALQPCFVRQPVPWLDRVCRKRAVMRIGPPDTDRNPMHKAAGSTWTRRLLFYAEEITTYLVCGQAGVVFEIHLEPSPRRGNGSAQGPGSESIVIKAHRSAEPGHRLVLEALDAEPLLDLGMRLGEGSGGAVALPLLRAACVLHSGMATFEQAGVSKKG